MKTIGTEEHLVTDEVVTAWSRLGSPAREDSRASVPPGEVGERLHEVGERRIAAMDEAGLDIQVISLTSPGLHNLRADEAHPPAGCTRTTESPSSSTPTRIASRASPPSLCPCPSQQRKSSSARSPT